jgi:hypothetical protein
MVWHILKIWYTRLKDHITQQVKRYADRYYRIGRHEPRAIGLVNLHWASTLTQQLRLEREVGHHV